MAYHHHRPLPATYSDNYQYGMSLYSSPGVGDIEKNYRNTLSRTQLRSDRGDLGLYTFAGSNLHGGMPAAEKGSAPKVSTSTPSTTKNIYAPLHEVPYGKGYYDHLRAVSPEPRRRPLKTRDLYDEPDFTPSTTFPSTRFSSEMNYKTLPTRYSDLDGDLRKTTTRTSETWVPLTTYIYHTPYHTYCYKSTPYSSYTYRYGDLYDYSYLDDYKRYSSTTKTTSKNVDLHDSSYSSKFDYNSYVDKCSKINSQLEEVNKWMSEAESKIRNEVVTSRNQLQKELAQVTSVVDDAARYNDELHEIIRKQSKQISKLNSRYEDINRNIGSVLDMLDQSKSRCHTLKSELESMQSSFKTVTTKKVTTFEY